MSSDPDFSPEHVNDCPACARMLKEQQAAEGLRCAVCLESFDKRYPFRSEDDDSLCKSCFVRVSARKSGEGARYGTRGDQR